MKRQVLAFFCIILLLISPLFSTETASASVTTTTDRIMWPEGPNVFTESAIVIEASTGLILYEKAINEARYPASITKIMTALLTIENANLGDTVTYSKNAIFDVDIDSSRIGIDVGEQLTVLQSLYAVLLESDNNASYALAEHISGSVDDFAILMNERAKSLGCLNTNFTNPHGLYNENHYTTAYDMSLITQEAMKNPTFRKIFSTRTYKIPPTNIQSEIRYLANHHKFVLKEKYRYDDCIGGKTGYTNKSRYTLVSVAKRGDLELICIIMKDDSDAHQYTDTQALFNFAFDNFSIYSIRDLESTEVISESPMFTRYNSLLSDSKSPVITDENGYVVLPNTASFEDARKDVTFFSASDAEETSSQLNHSIIGKISYSYDDKYVGGADILFNKSDTLSLVYNEAETTNPTESPKPFTPEKSGGSLRPIILGGIVGFFILIIGLYYVLVERPRLKRRSEFYKKRARRKLYHDDDFLNL